MAIYTKITLLKLIAEYNEHAKQIGDYDIVMRDSGMHKYPIALKNDTEDGEKHKYVGTLKDCIQFILEFDCMK